MAITVNTLNTDIRRLPSNQLEEFSSLWFEVTDTTTTPQEIVPATVGSYINILGFIISNAVNACQILFECNGQTLIHFSIDVKTTQYFNLFPYRIRCELSQGLDVTKTIASSQIRGTLFYNVSKV